VSRSFSEDARRIFSYQPDLLKVHGKEFIPGEDSRVVTFNHFYHPKFGACWLTLAEAATIPPEIHWIVTWQLNLFDKWLGAAIILQHIADLLPVQLRGNFA